MPSLLDLRQRIRSVQNTQQITKAMKTVSTAKFKKAQRTVIEGRPHWHEAPSLLARVSSWAGRTAHPLFDERLEKLVHVVVVTSDKGLCGAFNSNLLARAAQIVVEKSESAEVRLVLVGKKAANFFRRGPFPVERVLAENVDKLPRSEIGALARLLIRRYLFQETDGVYVVYNEFKTVLAPRVTVTRLLPVVPEPSAGGPGEPEWEPEWEPGRKVILDAFLPRYVEDQLAHALAESQAAEQAARMMAMDNASKNAGELITDLVLVMNKIRQAGITKELLEIMTAVEALKEA